MCIRDRFRTEVTDKVNQQNTELKETIKQQINGVSGKLDQQKSEVELLLENYEERNDRQLAEVKMNIETMEKRLDRMETEHQSLNEAVEEKLVENKQEVMEHVTRQLTRHKQDVTSNIQSMEHQLNNNNTKIEDTVVQLVLRVNEMEQNGNQTCVIREDRNTNHEVPHMKGYIRNPMEYLNRMQEYLQSAKENRWE